MIVYRVKLVEGFKDGNVYPRYIAPNEVVDVDEQTYRKMLRSAPDSAVLVEKLVPNPKKSRSKKSEDKA